MTVFNVECSIDIFYTCMVFEKKKCEKHFGIIKTYPNKYNFANNLSMTYNIFQKFGFLNFRL